MNAGSTYYVTLEVVNNAGLRSRVSSSGVRVDATPPMITKVTIRILAIPLHGTKALGKLGNIVAEIFVILDVSSNVSMFAHPWKHCSENKICFPRSKNVYYSKFRNI
jgi:hypothetical protein